MGEGVDYGRRATCLSQYCEASVAEAGAVTSRGAKEEENRWELMSKELAKNVAFGLHSWLHALSPTPPNSHSGEAILNQWKSYVDWDMELILRDTPKRERVTLNAI